MGGTGWVAGVIGFVLTRKGIVVLLEPLASDVPMPKHAAFVADLWTHKASYAIGLVGGMVLIVSTWRSWGRIIPLSVFLGRVREGASRGRRAFSAETPTPTLPPRT